MHLSKNLLALKTKNVGAFRPASLELLEFITGAEKQGHFYLAVIYDFKEAHNQTLAILLLHKD